MASDQEIKRRIYTIHYGRASNYLAKSIGFVIVIYYFKMAFNKTDGFISTIHS